MVKPSFVCRLSPAEVADLAYYSNRKRHLMARSGNRRWTPFFDTHWQPEFLYEKEFNAGNLENKHVWNLRLLETRHPYSFPRGFVGGVSIWCKPTHYRKFRSVMDADQRVYAAVGCHPHFAPMWNESVKDRIINMLDYSPRCVAWGEMGLDYNCQGGRSPDRDQQRVVFGLQLQAAVRRDLPIVIHGREAMDDIIKVMLAQPITQQYIYIAARPHLNLYSNFRKSSRTPSSGSPTNSLEKELKARNSAEQ